MARDEGMAPRGAVEPVCVVVPTYDRSALLTDLVAALRAQDHPDFGVVLVDNGSTDDTPDRLAQLVDGDDRFRVLRIDHNRGPARARNLGWRASTRPWVAFTDDDCVPEPSWLRELVTAAGPARIVQGRTQPMAEDAADPCWFDRSQRIEEWSGRYETCNLLVARDVLAELDGFNETFPVAMGEDTDLGLRAEARGTPVAFTDRAVVGHHVWRTGFRGFLQHRRRYAAIVELFRVNPAARHLLKWGFAVRGVHLLVWGLVPVTAVSVWAGVPWVPGAVALAWCLANVYRTRRRPFPAVQRLGYSVAQFVGYAYETACFAIASVRHRTLVL